MIDKQRLYAELVDRYKADPIFKSRVDSLASGVMKILARHLEKEQIMREKYDATQVSGIGPSTVTKEDFK